MGRLLTELQPEPEVIGLLSLMLLQDSRRAARTSPAGADLAAESGPRALEPGVDRGRSGIGGGSPEFPPLRPLHTAAAIAAVPAEAQSAAATNWRQIVALYNQLVRIQPSPIVHLNRAVAISERDGPEAGLAHIDGLFEHGELANYYLAHSARAELCRRLGWKADARASYEKALALTQQEPERQFLQKRIRQLK